MQDVARLDVAMDDAFAVDVLQRLQHVEGDAGHLPLLELPAALGQNVLERAALEELEHEHETATVRKQHVLVQPADMLVRDPRVQDRGLPLDLRAVESAIQRLTTV